MASTDDLLAELDKLVRGLMIELESTKKKNATMASELAEITEELDDLKRDYKVLENKNKEIKVVSGLAGNSEHKRLMKHKLNSLVKEIDLCIAEVKMKSM